MLDVDNGARFETYVIEGERGAGDMCLNGAAARLVQPGDRVIVVSYGVYSEDELEEHVPQVVHVDERNAIVRVDGDPSALPVRGGRTMSTEPRIPDAPPADRRPVTIPQLAEMKRRGEPIVMVTAYDYPERAGRRGGRRRPRAGRRHRRDDGARLRLHGARLDGRDGDARERRAPRRAHAARDRRPAVRLLPGLERAGRAVGGPVSEGGWLRRGQDGDGRRVRRASPTRASPSRARGDRGRRHPGDGPRRPDAAERVRARRLPHAGPHDAAGGPGRRRRARAAGRRLLRGRVRGRAGRGHRGDHGPHAHPGDRHRRGRRRPTGRCWSSTTCWACTRGTRRGS